jgi:hypothetical protein
MNYSETDWNLSATIIGTNLILLSIHFIHFLCAPILIVTFYNHVLFCLIICAFEHVVFDQYFSLSLN